MRAYERLIKYVKYDTKSSECSGEHPSTASQRVFADALAKELNDLGCKNVRVSKECYVYAELDASEGLTHISSTAVRNIIKSGGELSGLIPEGAISEINKIMTRR